MSDGGQKQGVQNEENRIRNTEGDDYQTTGGVIMAKKNKEPEMNDTHDNSETDKAALEQAEKEMAEIEAAEEKRVIEQEHGPEPVETPVIVKVYEGSTSEPAEKPEPVKPTSEPRKRGRPRKVVSRPVQQVAAGAYVQQELPNMPPRLPQIDALRVTLLANAELLAGAIAKVEISLAAQLLGLPADTDPATLQAAWRIFLESEGAMQMTPGEQLLVIHLIVFGPPILVKYLTPRAQP